MAAAGVPIRTVQAWMGHADIATTQRYAHYAPSPYEVEWVSRAFGAGPTGPRYQSGTNLSESHVT